MAPEEDGLKIDEGSRSQIISHIIALLGAKQHIEEGANEMYLSRKRIVPGLLIFLYIYDQNVNKELKLNTDTMISRQVLYRVMVSKEDADFQAEQDHKDSVRMQLDELRQLQSALVKSLENKEITVDEWMEKDKEYEAAIMLLKAKLNEVLN